MHHISTRGAAPAVTFEAALLAGLAPDGGLYLPAQWPPLSDAEIADLHGQAYADIAENVMGRFLDGEFAADVLHDIVYDSYRTFSHPAVAPLIQIDSNLWLLELFHGPTLAFKDFALQWLGRAFDHVLERAGHKVTVVGATSGDTGSAAIEACRDRHNIEIFMLHPEGRVSDVQRRQMTTVNAPNVHNLAVQGTFDDCQALVKALFADATFRDEVALTAVNSINWARVMAQVVYYISSAVSLGTPARAVTFSVPTGNFGDVYAGFVAAKMGLPVDRLIVATNRNDILARVLDCGQYKLATVTPTISPSMDIQVASNFERLLFDLCDRDGAAVTNHMEDLQRDGAFAISAAQKRTANAIFGGHRVDETETLAEISRVYAETGRFIDPHTAVGVAAARATSGAPSSPHVVLATAHPAKFPDAVKQATGHAPPVPERLAAALNGPENCAVIENDVPRLRDYIRTHRQL